MSTLRGQDEPGARDQVKAVEAACAAIAGRWLMSRSTFRAGVERVETYSEVRFEAAALLLSGVRRALPGCFAGRACAPYWETFPGIRHLEPKGSSVEERVCRSKAADEDLSLKPTNQSPYNRQKN